MFRKKDLKKYITFSVPIEKEDLKQDIWQAYYKISSKVSLNKFIKLNANMDTTIRKQKHAELNKKIVCVVLNT